jgi:hypothetical protein
MAARASVLGDLCYNHPTRWTLPERNWPDPPKDPHARVELTCVHAIVQVACRGPLSLAWQDFAGNDKHPAHSCSVSTRTCRRGVAHLSVQACSLRQASTPRGRGFLDGIVAELDPAAEKPVGCYKVGDLFLVTGLARRPGGEAAVERQHLPRRAALARTSPRWTRRSRAIRAWTRSSRRRR